MNEIVLMCFYLIAFLANKIIQLMTSSSYVQHNIMFNLYEYLQELYNGENTVKWKNKLKDLKTTSHQRLNFINYRPTFITSVFLVLSFIISNYCYDLSAMLQFSSCKPWDVHRYLTYAMLHKDWYHVGGNIILQIYLAWPLEKYNDWWRIIVVYLTGIIFGAIGHLLTTTDTLIGSSGGVYALFGANIALIVMNRNLIDEPRWSICLISLFTFLYYNCIIFWYGEFNTTSNKNHLFATLFGFLVALAVPGM